MRFGKIPTKILLVSRAASAFRCTWDDVDSAITEGLRVSPTFVADAESADSTSQALRWGRDHTRAESDEVSREPARVESNNNPIKLTVVGLEKRMEGGRAFKVIDSANRLFDLREDVLLETIKTVGVSSGGCLNGEFVFAKIGSQMRLVRVGSQLHAELLDSQQRRSSKNIKTDELVVGGVYANRRGLVIYLGRIDTVEDIQIGVGGYGPFTSNAASHWKVKGVERGAFKRVVVTGEHLTVSIAKHDQEDAASALENAVYNVPNGFYFHFAKSFGAVKLVKRLKLDDDFIEKLRTRALERTQSDNLRKDWLYRCSALLNIRRHGEGAKVCAEYEAMLSKCKK